MTLKRGITLQREIIEKKYVSVIFDEASINEISRPYLKFETVFDISIFMTIFAKGDNSNKSL